MTMNSAHLIGDRIGPIKSRLGCRTCKRVLRSILNHETLTNLTRIRKVKCGEERPSCRRCTSTGRKCEYGNPGPYMFASAPSSDYIIDHPLSLTPNTVWRERRAFAYYSQHAVPYLSGRQDLHFWGGVVLQICRCEPAVWDAINTISALFENPDQCLDPVFLGRREDQVRPLSQIHQEALTWYSRSLSRLRIQIERGRVDLHTAVVSCVLFTCIEALQGRIEAALRLYQQGVRLILDLRARASWGSIKAAFLEDTIVPLFIRLGAVALSISGVPACDLFGVVGGHMEYSFTSYDAARSTIIAVAAESMLFERSVGGHFAAAGYDAGVPRGFIVKQNLLQSQLASWYRAYTHFRQTGCSKPPDHSDQDPSAAAVLLAYHAATSVLVSTCLATKETVYDDYTRDFRVVVEQARVALDASAGPDNVQPPFTFEMGVALPLYFTVMKCRHPRLRREALLLLRKSPPIQGLYKCTPGSIIGGTIMKLEEEFSLALSLTSRRTAAIASEVGSREDGDCAVSWNEQGGSISAVTPDPERDDSTSRAILIPEEARIRFIGIFQPRDTPWHASDHDIGKWGRNPDQIFLKFARIQREPAKGTWSLVDEIVPMDY